MKQEFKNNASSVLDSPINSTADTLDISTGDGDLFPAALGDDYFYVTLVEYDANGNEIDWEIIYVGSRSNDTLNELGRGWEGTTARSWPSGTRVENRLTASSVGDLTNRADPESITGYWTFEIAPSLKGNVNFVNSALIQENLNVGESSSVNSSIAIKKSFSDPSFTMERSSLFWIQTFMGGDAYQSLTSGDFIFKTGASENLRIAANGDVTAPAFIGSGAGLTNVHATTVEAAQPYTPFALTDVTTTGQTRTLDVANGTVQTLNITATGTTTINVTGPANKAVSIWFYVYNSSGGQVFFTEGSNIIGSINAMSTPNTNIHQMFWDGERLFTTVLESASGDLRPT